MLRFSGTSDIRRFVKEYLDTRDDLAGNVIVDIPAGSGAMSRVLHEKGAVVKPFDLFPEFFDVEGLTCEAADIMARIPMEDATADMVLFQEGIEHLPDQLAALREINRILKPGGTLLLTTPNISSLRARVSHLFTESELWKRMPPNELDALWFTNDQRMYFGHLFLIGIQRLRVLAIAAGFELRNILPVRASASSLLLGWLYPLVVAVNWLAYVRNLRKRPELPMDEKRRTYRAIRRLNCNRTILFGRHIFAEFTKTAEPGDIALRVNRPEDTYAAGDPEA